MIANDKHDIIMKNCELDYNALLDREDTIPQVLSMWMYVVDVDVCCRCGCGWVHNVALDIGHIAPSHLFAEFRKIENGGMNRVLTRLHLYRRYVPGTCNGSL
jgi:hypothetical protein